MRAARCPQRRTRHVVIGSATSIGEPMRAQLRLDTAEFLLTVTASNRQPGDSDGAIRAWTCAPENLMEIQRLPR